MGIFLLPHVEKARILALKGKTLKERLEIFIRENETQIIANEPSKMKPEKIKLLCSFFRLDETDTIETKGEKHEDKEENGKAKNLPIGDEGNRCVWLRFGINIQKNYHDCPQEQKRENDGQQNNCGPHKQRPRFNRIRGG